MTSIRTRKNGVGKEKKRGGENLQMSGEIPERTRKGYQLKAQKEYSKPGILHTLLFAYIWIIHIVSELS